MFRKYSLPVLAIILLALFAIFALRMSTSNYLVVRNLSGENIQDVVIVLRRYGGQEEIRHQLSEMSHGQVFRFHHGWNDSSLDLRFIANKSEKRFEVPYIDLWTGQGWAMEIGPDGVVQSGYDHSK